MKRRLSCAATLAGALALAVPMPGAGATGMLVSTCNGGMAVINLPGDGSPADHGCCRKACHAGLDRKKRDGKSACCA